MINESLVMGYPIPHGETHFVAQGKNQNKWQKREVNFVVGAEGEGTPSAKPVDDSNVQQSLHQEVLSFS